MPWKATIGGKQHDYLVKVTISSKEVHLPNASSLGFDKRTARPGNWIVWKANKGSDAADHGRVLGKIVEHSNDQVDITGYLAVLVVNEVLTSAFIQYVHPADVLRCTEVNGEFMRVVMGIDIDEKSVVQIANVVAYGAMNNRCVDTILQKTYCHCKEHGVYKADDKIITCPKCALENDNEAE